MNILFIGDIVGKPGRSAVARFLPELRTEFSIDLVIANGENASHGRGITLGHYDALRDAGVDWFTSGDHIWQRADIFPYLDDPSIHILRPANYTGTVPGRGLASFTVESNPVHLINLQGQVFMKSATDNPFLLYDKLTQKLSGIILVDFHAEATSEKWALAHHLDGRATAVVGTHTHVPTADERIFPQGMGFITDIGMTGTIDSNIGAEKSEIVQNFLTGLPWRYEVANEGPVWFNAVLFSVDPKTAKTTSIQRIQKILHP